MLESNDVGERHVTELRKRLLLADGTAHFVAARHQRKTRCARWSRPPRS